jgi:tetratricopeptide (TPR) repeat protein
LKTNLDFICDFRGKFEQAMSIKEIEKLKEKVDKDLNSKLFVPLAEEYRKEGMLDEAIAVLKLGLERHPGYMSARVSLGKINLEKGQMIEARTEFENVIQSIPDNLYAHKKLAEIYRDTGERDLAIKAYRTVLKLNPMDEEILNNLRDLEGTSAEQPAWEPQPSTPPAEKAAATKEKAPFEAMTLEQTSHDQAQPEPVESGEEIDAFKESLFGIKDDEGEGITGKSLAVEVEDVPELAELPEEADEQFSFDEAESVSATESADDVEVPDVGKMAEEVDEGWSFGEVEGEPETEALVVDDVAEAAEITEEAEADLFFGDAADSLETEGEGPLGEVEMPSQGMFREEMHSGADSIRPRDNRELFQTAEEYISEGKYLGAINIYQRILAGAPDDRMALQRIEELRSLLKLMGKDKEVLVSNLNAFLNAIKKRGDEFHKRS